MKEIWKDVVGYEGEYLVSNFGRVMSLKINYYKKIFCGGFNTDGYPVLTLRKNNKGKTHKVHALVAGAFIGKRPIGLVVNHKDGNRTNNYIENLEYVSQSENCSHAKIISKKQFSSKYIGVCHFSCDGVNKWLASKRVEGKAKHIGLYDTEEEAAKGYQDFIKTNGITNKYSTPIKK